MKEKKVMKGKEMMKVVFDALCESLDMGKKNLAADGLSRVPIWRKADVEDPSANIFSVRRTLYRKWHGVKVRTIKKSAGKEEGLKTRKSISTQLN